MIYRIWFEIIYDTVYDLPYMMFVYELARWSYTVRIWSYTNIFVKSYMIWMFVYEFIYDFVRIWVHIWVCFPLGWIWNTASMYWASDVYGLGVCIRWYALKYVMGSHYMSWMYVFKCLVLQRISIHILNTYNHQNYVLEVCFGIQQVCIERLMYMFWVAVR